MSSLTQLNNYSNNTVAFTDNRPAGVKLTWPNARNILDFVAESSSFPVERRVDIDEIIDPNGTLNLTYSIDLSSVPGASLTWTTLFSGSITSEVNQVYSVRAIETINDWDFVKAPTITLPDDFQGSFEYTCSLTYLAASGLTTKSWTVGSFVPVSNLSAQFTQTVTPTYFKGIVNEEFASSFTLLGGGLEFDIAEADFASTFDINADVDRSFRGFTSFGYVNSTLTADLDLLVGNANLSKTAVFGLTASGTVTDALANASESRTYVANTSTRIFQQTPQPELTLLEDGTVYKIKIQVFAGFLGGDTLESNPAITVNIQDTDVSVLENKLLGLKYYPPSYNYTSDVYYQLTLYADDVQVKQYTTAVVENDSTDTTVLTGLYDTVVADQLIWLPTIEQYLYCNTVDFYVFGSGGGGANNGGGGGGGAGELKTYLNQSFSSNNSFVLDSGGDAGEWGAGSFGITNAGSQGEQATWIYYNNTGSNSNIIVRGGFGGGDNSNGTGLQQGSNTPGSSFTGGSGFLNEAGGGGAGSSGNGQDATSATPKLAGEGGTGTTINGFEYGRGGGGAESGTAAYRLADHGIGSGGHGASSYTASHNLDGGPSGIVIRMYHS